MGFKLHHSSRAGYYIEYNQINEDSAIAANIHMSLTKYIDAAINKFNGYESFPATIFFEYEKDAQDFVDWLISWQMMLNLSI